MFDSAAPPYQEALARAGYTHKLEFNENEGTTNERKKRKRKRNVLYFNAPFNMNVESKVGRDFLKIIDTSFPVGNPLTLFRSGGYQIDTCLPFSLYLRHGFRTESEQTYQNRVKWQIYKTQYQIELLHHGQHEDSC